MGHTIPTGLERRQRALGRFLQTDPIGYEDNMNLYAYTANDPVNNTDPTGLESSFRLRKHYQRKAERLAKQRQEHTTIDGASYKAVEQSKASKVAGTAATVTETAMNRADKADGDVRNEGKIRSKTAKIFSKGTDVADGFERAATQVKSGAHPVDAAVSQATRVLGKLGAEGAAGAACAGVCSVGSAYLAGEAYDAYAGDHVARGAFNTSRDVRQGVAIASDVGRNPGSYVDEVLTKFMNLVLGPEAIR